MSRHIIQAIRYQTQLKANTFLIATELAHRMNGQGYGQVSYQYLAWKAHCSRRTVIRRMHDLEGVLFSCTRYRTKAGNAINLYKYLLPLTPFYRTSPATTHGDTLASILPEPKAAEAKERSLREDLRRQRWGLQNLSLSQEARTRCEEELVRLEGLLRC